LLVFRSDRALGGGRLMWEDRYAASGEYLFGRAPAAFLSENAWLTRGVQTALCVADGEGRNAVHLARAGVAATSFDMSPTAVERALALAAEAGVSVEAHVSDWEGWDWTRQFDAVFGIFIQFMGSAERKRQFETLRAAVKPGGRVVLHGYTPEQIALGTGGPPFAENMYTAAFLADAFAGWQIERLSAYERDVQEGRGHSGRSALIDLVARKLV
jgi:cyclopropane fatty-acyl-phospholipid synthase-like methyltransferase